MVEKKAFLHDCFASEYLMLRLIAAVILLAILLSMAIGVEKDSLLQISEQQIQGEIHRLERTALLLHRSGGERNGASQGNLQVLNLRLPESMDYAAFGAGVSLSKETGFEEANLYHYKLKNGVLKSFSSNVKFCAAEYINETPVPLIGKPAVLYPGSYDVYLELVRVENQTCVMIFQREDSNAAR